MAASMHRRKPAACCSSSAAIWPIVLIYVLASSWSRAASAETGDLSAVAKLVLNTAGREWKWPPYERGRDKYQWVLSPTGRARGLSHLGSAARLRTALSKLIHGQNITITAIGGSITAGQGAVDAPNWVQYMTNYLTDEHGEVVSVANGAVGGTLSSYMSVCLNVHVPKHSDIVFVEYNQNDLAVSSPPFNNPQRKHFERLLRKLLMYPNRPAVILFNSYTWMMPNHQYPGLFYGSAEREFSEFALFYDLPSLSIKACCHQLMAESVPGFCINQTRNVDHDKWKNVAFNYDNIHPDGNTGMRVMGELALGLIQSTLEGLKQEPLSEEEVAVARGPLPEPMIQNNYQSLSDVCFIGNHFNDIVTRKDGFEWINEAKGHARSKWGMVATEVGSVLEMTVSTVATSVSTGDHRPHHHQQRKLLRHTAVAGDPLSNYVLVELAYLQSYDKMGRANVSCVSGCECQTTELEGHTKHRSSQLHLHTFYVSQAEKCVIQVKVRPDSTVPGNHKVKVAGLMISEEAGSGEGIRNNLAVEYVHDVSFQSKDSTFDVKNHV